MESKETYTKSYSNLNPRRLQNFTHGYSIISWCIPYIHVLYGVPLGRAILPFPYLLNSSNKKANIETLLCAGPWGALVTVLITPYSEPMGQASLNL